LNIKSINIINGGASVEAFDDRNRLFGKHVFSGVIMSFLPTDLDKATLIGRMDFGKGPTPVAMHAGKLMDLSGLAPTVADLLNATDPGGLFEGPAAKHNSFETLRASWEGGDGQLLVPIDLQCIKAAGVTFANSALERVIEEKAGGDPAKAERFRLDMSERIGSELRNIRPGSPASTALKKLLIVEGLWSQYLEVAIGPDAEIFTKAPVLAAVGWGQDIGVRSDSEWNNPEPELVIICDGAGCPRGATLGNDVNLRDFEGRSALLLGKAKDNNASCAIGPFIRLFDDSFTLDDVRSATVSLSIDGPDGFKLRGQSEMSQISRDPLELVSQAFGQNHQYPDGFALFMGTMFAPVQDRAGPGRGFTHSVGDIVRISSPKLGTLENRVVFCADAPEWRMGIGALMRNLAERGLLKGEGQ
jgi:fumarylacetoacetate (FAA) hydrolase family protein